MATAGDPITPAPRGTRRIARAANVIVVSSVMFTFISYWRTAAVVLCDLASTAYYIGGIVEQAIGPAAPWFILAVMVFSYFVRSVYIESCSLFVRGGVYRVVKEAMGGFLAKLSVSALMFDYILTGPISGVSAGQYIIGLGLEAMPRLFNISIENEETKNLIKGYGSVVIASIITLYFFYQNLLGIHESSEKALTIMKITTVMAVVILVWCGITLAIKGIHNSTPVQADFHPKTNYSTNEMEDPLGFMSKTPAAQPLRELKGANWISLIGLLGLFVAFGHSILAMSGEETLAQVYREVESPKLPNFKKAAFIVFLYSLLLTAGISFLAVWIIPDEVRMKDYADNLIGGLAMNVVGPIWARLLLNAFVVIVGFLILAGAVNTAIIGSNGVLNRVAEDGVLPDWFLKPHHRYGTTYRVLWLIVILQLLTILASRGDVLLLGEAYAFGVVWSFVFKALAMVVLRFRDRSPREFKVPFNVRVGDVEIPIGLGLIFLVLLASAIVNLMTKQIATVSGLAFTGAFLSVFVMTEFVHERRRKDRSHHHEHLEQFNQETVNQVNLENLGLTKPYRKLVAIRSPQNLFMLEKALEETDPEITSVVVMTAKLTPAGEGIASSTELDDYDQHLMTAVVDRAEKAGKQVKPLIVPTNNPLNAVILTAKELQVQELVMGASNKYTADEQLDQIALYWINANEGEAKPITIRILGRDRDVYFDLGGGSRIPKITERKARSVAELRKAGVGVDRVLLAHDGRPESSDLFQAVLTMLDPMVVLTLVPLLPPGSDPYNGPGVILQDQELAKQLGREMNVHYIEGDFSQAIVHLAREEKYGLIIYGLTQETPEEYRKLFDVDFVVDNAPCRVCLVSPPIVPRDTEDSPTADALPKKEK